MINLREEEESGIVPEYGELPVLFEDDHMLIVNKPAGMATHPNEAGQTGTLSNLVAFYFQMNGEERKLRHVHRLDKIRAALSFFKAPPRPRAFRRTAAKRKNWRGHM